MSFDPYTWYVLSCGVTPNNTLTAANNSQAAFDPNSPSAIYYAPSTEIVPNYQQWQIFPINASSSSTNYILRNRQIGSNAYLTTAWTTRKCGGGSCATVPVLSPDVNAESLWNFASWGFSDPTGGAYVYNLGNGTEWRLDQMDAGTEPELVNFDDTGRLAQHWFVNAHTTFAASDSSSFATVPSTATALAEQYAAASASGSAASVTPYTVVASGSQSSTATKSSSATNSSSGAADAGSSASSQHTGLSTGAAIGIGVGIGVALLILLVGGIIALLYYRRKRRANTPTSPKNMSDIGSGYEQSSTSGTMMKDPSHYAELNTPVMMKAPEAKAEMLHPSEQSRSELMNSDGARSELEDPSTLLTRPQR